MKTLTSIRRRQNAAFTLIEVLIGLTLGSMAMGWIGLASISLQRSYEAANYQMTAQNDQLRVLDYVSRDLRMATAVSVQNSNSKVVLTLPATTATVTLNIGPLLNAVLGTPANAPATMTVSYYVEGGQFIRDVNGAQTVLADTIADLKFTVSGSFMTTDVLFSPSFSNSPTIATQQNTRASNITFMRNLVPGT